MSEQKSLEPIKRLATDEEVDKLVKLLFNASCVSDIPSLDPNVYFTLVQISKIYFIHTLFQKSLNDFFEKLEYGRKKDRDIFIALVEGVPELG